jgi:hypothetical protein
MADVGTGRLPAASKALVTSPVSISTMHMAEPALKAIRDPSGD